MPGEWPQVLAKVGLTKAGLSFDFRPREGAVLAGGYWLPLVASSYDREARELVLVFRRVEVSAETAGALRRDCAGCPVDRVTLRPGGRNPGAGTALRWRALWRAEVLSLGGGLLQHGAPARAGPAGPLRLGGGCCSEACFWCGAGGGWCVSVLSDPCRAVVDVFSCGQ